MIDNMKDFTILCITSNKENVKLRIRNMPDSDEREKINFIEKKVEHLFRIYFRLIVVFFSMDMVCVFGGLIVGTINQVLGDLIFGYLNFWIPIISIIVFFGSIVSSFLKIILRKYFVKKENCDFIWRYLKGYSNENWNCLKRTVGKTYSILSLLDARTPEGTPLYTDPSNSAGNTVAI